MRQTLFPFVSQLRIARIVRSCRAVALFLFSALACVGSANAQQTPWSWGVWTSGSLAMPSSDVREFPGAPSCLAESARLDNRSGSVFGAGGDAGYAVAADVALAARIGLTLATTTFSTQERIGSASDARGALNDVVAEYRSVIDATSIVVEPSIRWHPTRPLVLTVGLRFSQPISTTLDYREQLVAPSQATYADGSVERARVSRPLDEYSSAWFGITLSAGMDIAVAKTVNLRPEIGGIIALSSPLRDGDWRPHELRAGVAIIVGTIGESTPIVPYAR